MVRVQGEIGTLIDEKKRVLAIYIKRTGFIKQISGVSRKIADLSAKVDSCIRDFIVVHDDEVILVIVDTNQPRKDQRAFNTLTQMVRLELGESGAAYKEVPYPSNAQYDPRRIYDSPNYCNLKPARRRRMLRPR